MLSVALPTDSTLPKSAALSQGLKLILFFLSFSFITLFIISFMFYKHYKIVKMLPMDLIERDDESFPPGQVDEHNEQLDLRRETSWTQSIDQISPVELMEVQIVNSTVPFMFVSSFTPLLKVCFVCSLS